MKKTLSLLTILIFYSTFSQQNKEAKSISNLKTKIQNSEKGERLKWMDSLSNFIAQNTNFESDSINNYTQKYAIELDSIDIVARQTIHLMYFQNIIKGNPNAAKKIFENYQYIIPKIKNNTTKCKLIFEGANSYFYLGKYEKAISQFEKLNQLAQKNKLESFAAKAHQGIGSSYTEMGNFGKGSIYLQKAIKIFQKLNDTNAVMDARNSLSILYSKNNFFKEAKDERDAIVKLSLENKKYDLIPVYYFNYTGDFKKQGNQKDRILYLKKAINASDKSEFKGFLEPYLFASLATAYAETDSLKKAKHYFQKLQKINDGVSESSFKSVYLEAQKSIAFLEKDYQNAIQYGKEYVDLVKTNKQYEEIEFGEKFLIDVYSEINDEANALLHFKNYLKLRDSIGNAQNLRVLSYYQTIYETEKRDLTIKSNLADIKLLNKQNELKKQYIIFGGIGFITFLGLLLLYHSMKNIRLREQQRQQFTTQLINSQELERSRVAKELHDSVGQKLLVLKNALTLKSQNEEELQKLLNSVVTEVREISHNLHPYQFEILGFVGALEDLIENFQRTSKTFYSTDISIPKDIIPKEKEIIIFRIIQECLTNVEKHANATACQLVVKQSKDNILFTITDNGKGFDTSITSLYTNGLGNISMKERAIQINGILKIDSKLGSGTTVNLTIQKS
jgi:signal transduction histidine kinase